MELMIVHFFLRIGTGIAYKGGKQIQEVLRSFLDSCHKHNKTNWREVDNVEKVISHYY